MGSISRKGKFSMGLPLGGGVMCNIWFIQCPLLSAVLNNIYRVPRENNNLASSLKYKTQRGCPKLWSADKKLILKLCIYFSFCEEMHKNNKATFIEDNKIIRTLKSVWRLINLYRMCEHWKLKNLFCRNSKGFKVLF